MTSSRRTAGALLLALAGIAVLSAVMVPVRHHLSVATPALVLVVPVVSSVVIGGFAPGIVAAVAGFMAYDLLFIPPYSTLNVDAGQNWVALAVYVVVVLLVARLVSFLQEARAEARRQEEATRRMYDLVDRLIVERPLPELLRVVLSTVHESFHPRWVAALLPADGQSGGPLEVAATAGEPLGEAEHALLRPAPGRLQSVIGPAAPGITRVALATTGRPVGVLALADVHLTSHDRELLGVFAHQAAQAVERSQLREQALRAEVLEESDRWRRALMGAVSHDLRTPLAAIKTAVTTLRDDVAPAGAQGHTAPLGAQGHTAPLGAQGHTAPLGAPGHTAPLGAPDSTAPPGAPDSTAPPGALGGTAPPGAPDHTAPERAVPLGVAERDELLELIEGQTDGLARLVTDLLDLSRLESGALRLQREPTAVEDIVEAAVASLGTALQTATVETELPTLLAPVDVDELLMVQVVVNLLENAARHSPTGSPVVVEAARHGGTVELAVVDHGPGVPRADRHHIFEMFDRGDGGGRAGLGLAIARAFVEAHGQRIFVEDAPGGGARFVVTLPVAPSAVHPVASGRG